MADYGFVKTSSGGAQSKQNQWNQGNWSNGPTDDMQSQARQAQQAGMQAQQQNYAAAQSAMQQDRSAFSGGNSAFSTREAARPASTYASGGGSTWEYNPWGTPDQPAGLMGEYSQSAQNAVNAARNTAGGGGQGGGYNPQMPNFQQMGAGLAQQDFPQPTIFNSDGSLNAGLFSAGNGLANQSIDWYGAAGNQQTAASYVNTMQNLYNMYNQDREYQTNQARWVAEAQQSQWRDQQQANLENSRLGLDTWTAQQADRQFQQQLQQQNSQFGAQLGLDQQAQNWLQQYQQGQLNLGSRDADTAQYVAEQNAAYQQGQLGLGGRQADTQQYEAETGRMLGQEQNRITDWYNQQRVGIEQQAARVDEMYKSGLISNQQRELALKELTQQQDNTFRQAQMAQQESQFGRELASTEQYRQLQAQIEREQMANAYKTAVMNAVGRNQAQNVRFLRG